MNRQLLDCIFDIIAKLVEALALDQEKITEPVPEHVPEPVPEPEPPVVLEPTPQPDDKPDPRPETFYIPWATREDWAKKLRLAYSVWHGERDYSAIFSNGPIWKDKLWPYSRADIVQFMKEASETNARGNRLQWRITTKRHVRYGGTRSQVRKSVANFMYDQLKAESAKHAVVAAFFPNSPFADSIKGKLEIGVYPSS